MCALTAHMLHNIANKNSSWQAVLRWPWLVFFFCPGVCRREFVAQRYLPSTTTCLITQSTFLASVPFGNRVGSSPAVQSEWNLRLCQFSSLWSRPHSAYLILRCITSTIRFCSVWKTALFFCRACEITQTPNLQSSLRSVALRACWVQIAHTSTVLPVGSLEANRKRSQPHQHSQSTVPAIEWLFSPLSLFLIFAPALSCVWFTPVLLSIANPLCYQASSQSPLDSVSKQTGRERVRGRGWGVGRTDKATSVSDTNMAPSQHQYHVCAPSFSASHEWLTLPLALPPSLSPSKSVLCLHSLSQSCYFGSKGGGLAWWGSVFFLIQPCVAQWGGGWLELWSGFKSGIEERRGGRGSSAGVEHRLLWSSELRGQ